MTKFVDNVYKSVDNSENYKKCFGSLAEENKKVFFTNNGTIDGETNKIVRIMNESIIWMKKL